jgi:hypothetical protein
MNDETLRLTIDEMYRLAHEYTGDVRMYGFRDLYQVFDAARNIPYATDIDSTGVDECLKRPLYGSLSGDCDDKTIFSAASLQLLGIPWRIVTVSYTPDQQMQHVYLEVKYNNVWLPFDPTYPQNKIFTERTYTKKLIWTDNMIYNRGNNVHTLEGMHGIIADVTGLNDVSSALKDLSNTLQNLPLIGSLFKGKTTHVDYDTARSKQSAMYIPIDTLYRALPTDGQAQYCQLAMSYYMNVWTPTFGTWWSSFPANELTAEKKVHGTPVANYDWLKFYITDPYYCVLTQADAASLDSTLPVWYTTPFNKYVTTPLTAWIAAKYNTTPAALEQATQPTSPAAISATATQQAGMSTILILGLVGAGLMMLTGKKGKKRS